MAFRQVPKLGWFRTLVFLFSRRLPVVISGNEFSVKISVEDVYYTSDFFMQVFLYVAKYIETGVNTDTVWEAYKS